MQCWDMEGRPKPPCGNHALQPRFEVLELLVDGGALFGSLLLAIGLLLGAQLFAGFLGQLLLLLFGLLHLVGDLAGVPAGDGAPVVGRTI